MPRRKRTPWVPDSETELDGGLSFAHSPFHAHLLPEDAQVLEAGARLTEDSEVVADLADPLRGDRGSIALLLLLYVLQGIPLGLTGAVPMILSSRKVSYTEQAMFSFVYWPFSIKLLWAPIVDAAYFSSFGRRKSWLVPTQYLIGAFMLYLSGQVARLLGDDGSEAASIFTLTVVFFMLNFLAATQDIAVDGWALTMLSRRNVGYASTCNSVGQTAGYFLGNIVFLALESADFSNKFLRSTPTDTGLVTLGGFLWFWGIVFMVTTTLVWMLKPEKESQDDRGGDGIMATYKLLGDVVRLPSVQSYVITLITCKVGFAAADAVTGLKLIEAGVPKEKLALLGVPVVPLQIILPFVISKYVTRSQPLSFWLKAMPWRLLMGLIFAVLVYWTQQMHAVDGEFPLYYYAIILITYGLHQVALYIMFVAIMAFHAKVSDPAIGGTYMTLLNTVSNLGGNWPVTVALWFVDELTWKSCSADPKLACGEECAAGGGTCTTSVDGYYVESLVCVLLGFAWLLLRGGTVRKLQNLPMSAWKVA
ncbi:PREDICTED: acetyl-coenzyme A transporter 1-like [Priapulus caudatus]|uniref:Acetyl-coenzyme A transporter 1-like n=1 Tax=Priapulus caudatus TaxID=37621 RepID=A0ABM1E3B7_PRICU|nr:PREDICTED: acetyl-coenzyme A transporter 1-like [Priapulus caudatus]